MSPFEGFFLRRFEQTHAYKVKWNYIGYIENALNSVLGLNGNRIFEDIKITLDSINSVITVENFVSNGTDKQIKFYPDTKSAFDNIQLTIGGSLINGVDESGGWKETWKGTIESLVIRDVE